jgi:hypothetical protein
VLVEVADADELVELLLPALFAAALMSMGITSGLLPALPTLTEPSDATTSGLAAKKLRVYLNGQHQHWNQHLRGSTATYMTFWAMYGCAQEGIWLISMLEPQLAAMELFAVCMFM